MIDKRSGKVAYAVMSFGGFLGMGQERGGIKYPGLVSAGLSLGGVGRRDEKCQDDISPEGTNA